MKLNIPAYILIILTLAVCTQAKTRADGGGAAKTTAGGATANLSAAEFERRFRPYFEQKSQNRRVSRQSRISRPTNRDLLALARAWDGLTPEFRELYKKATDISPEDYDEYHISPSGKFKIFYSTAGENKVDLTDTMGYGNGQPASWRERNSAPNGVPDYIDVAAFALDSAWAMVIDRFGFIEPINAPDPDGAADYYSVLISNMEDYGVTWPYKRRTAGTPGFSSYIEINSDWSGPEWNSLGYNERPYDALKVTCAHEFLHSVHYAMAWTLYLDDLPYGWLEGAAVLMEEAAFPDVNDYFQYLSSFFRNPKVALLTDFNEYMNVLLFKYLYEKTNPADSIGFIKAVHDDYRTQSQRTFSFHKSLESASQKYAGKPWAELLNGFHAESYFTGNRARRPEIFVSDAEVMDVWAIPAATAANSETKAVRPRSVEFFFYTPTPDHPDTLALFISGQRDAAAAGNTWGASAIVMENSGNAEAINVQMNQNGTGEFILADWKEKYGCLLAVTNASPSSNRNVTVKFDGYAPPDTVPDAPKSLAIYPNVARPNSVNPIRISGGNITEIKIITQEGKLLASYKNGDDTPAFRKTWDGSVEWYPDRRLAPGVCFISATSHNPVSNRKSTLRRKVMILPPVP